MTRCVLVVDDVAEQIHVTARALGSDYAVIAATNGERALALARDQRPELIILDMYMPGLDGRGVLARLRAQPETQGIPVIFLTSERSPEVESEALRAGASDFVAKPINADVLRSRVGLQFALLDRQRELVQLNESLEEKVLLRTAALDKALKKAEAANLAKTHFLGKVSHELLTPLHQIMGALTLVQRKPDSDKVAGWLKTGIATTAHLQGIVESLLRVAQFEAGISNLTPEPFALDELMASVATEFRPAAGEDGLALDVLAPTGQRALVGDWRLLQAALHGYLSNAIKFSSRGRITVWASVEESRGDRLLLKFHVRDEGPGVAPGVADRLFQLFEQADNSFTRAHGGIGLGLVRVRRIAEMMEGTAGVSQPDGPGSEFWFTAWLAVQAGVKP